METIRPTTAIILDVRHAKKDKTLPIKLRVTSSRTARFYAVVVELPDGTMIDSLTPEALKQTKSEKPEGTPKEKKLFKEIGLLLADKEKFATEIINELKDNFTFEDFKDRFSGIKKTSDTYNVFYWYAEKIKELEGNDQLGTASSYDLSLKSLKAFIKHSTGKEPLRLHFKEITVKWLQRYEAFMTGDKTTVLPDGTFKIKDGLTRTTVGIYLRPLRAIFKKAIKTAIQENTTPPAYPFGLEEYSIPKGKKVKKAFTKDQLGLLFNAEAQTPEQAKARDFWFFSYTCNGMNIKDICLLRNEKLESDSFSFERAKTERTKEDQLSVNVMLTDFANSIIEKYRNPDTSPKAFVFGILSQTDNGQEKRNKVQAFTRFINQHIKKLAVSVGLTHDISTYYARHSFATLAIKGGASIEFVSEALSHSDIKTTRGYFAGFADTTKKEVLEGLMKF
jgi:integrase/recombinase XerD